MNRRITDPEFGELETCIHGWLGSAGYDGDSICVILGAENLEADQTLRAFARANLARVSALDDRARAFARQDNPGTVLQRLASIAFIYPSPTWIRLLQADGVEAARRLSPTRPILSVCYELLADDNVLEIEMDGDVFLDADYHGVYGCCGERKDPD
jgi:hypothetical protein